MDRRMSGCMNGWRSCWLAAMLTDWMDRCMNASENFDLKSVWKTRQYQKKIKNEKNAYIHHYYCNDGQKKSSGKFRYIRKKDLLVMSDFNIANIFFFYLKTHTKYFIMALKNLSLN